MGEDTFNSLCVPVKREWTSMSYPCSISLFVHSGRGGPWAHLGDSAAAAAAATHYGPALHVQSAAVVTMPLMNSGRAEREKKDGLT